MQPSFILSAVAAVVSFASMAQATPLPCPDVCSFFLSLPPLFTTYHLLTTQAKIDLILNGKLAPDACCGGGICKGDILSKYRLK